MSPSPLALNRRWQELSLYFLALDCFTRYMESPQSREFVTALQLRETNGEQLPVKTVSVGLVRLSSFSANKTGLISAKQTT